LGDCREQISGRGLHFLSIKEWRLFTKQGKATAKAALACAFMCRNGSGFEQLVLSHLVAYKQYDAHHLTITD
jgi:hypothetical protein